MKIKKERGISVCKDCNKADAYRIKGKQKQVLCMVIVDWKKQVTECDDYKNGLLCPECNHILITNSKKNSLNYWYCDHCNTNFKFDKLINGKYKVIKDGDQKE